MPSPTAALATLRPDLAGSFMEFPLEMLRQGFVATQVLPTIEVQKASGKFGKIPIEQLLQNRETLRAPGAGYSRGNYTFTPASFATDEHGAEEPVDDREATLYREYFDAEMVAAARARHAVMINMEKRVSAAVFNSTTWTGAALTTAVSTEWSTTATAKPRDDVRAAMQKVYDNSGLWPNALIVNLKVRDNLRDNTQVIDRLKYAGFTDPRPGRITDEALAQALGIDRLIVAGAPKNTAAEGQAATIAPVWSGEYAMVCKIATSMDIREPCIGRVFHWGEDGSSIGGTMESYRDETKRSDIIRVRHDVDEQILYTEAGHLLSNITA